MTLVAYNLQADHRTTPIGIDATSLRLSWRLRSSWRAQNQTACRVTLLETNPASSIPDREVWNSSWVKTAQTFLHPHLPALAPRTCYRWLLELKDSDGTEASTTESWFETSLLDVSNIDGSWISRDPRIDSEVDPPQDDDISAKVRHIPPASYLRHEFATPDKQIARARIYATAHGVYRVHLNGSRVGDDELSPGWTDYTDRLLYQTFDVSDRISSGANAIGIVIADGWWSGYVGFDSRRQGKHYGSAPEVWAQLEIDFSDGSHQRIVTGSDWVENNGPIYYSDLLMGEYVDDRADLGGWTTCDYDSSAWRTVRVRNGGFGTLVAMSDEPIRATERIPAISVVPAGRDKWIYDFGQNVVGRVQVTLGPLNANQRVVLRHGEMLENGQLYVNNLRTAEATDIYVSSGTDVNQFEPSFTVHGFRYVEISGTSSPPSLSRVAAVVLGNDIAWSGQISTSSADVNRLISNIRWGQRGNFVGVPTDCPQRDERLGWMADAQVFLPTAALNADVGAFFTRWLRDVRFAQTAEGSFPDIAPVVSQFFVDGAPAWGDGGVIIPWHLYRVYGDIRFLTDSFDSMKRWVNFVEANNPSLIWNHRVGNNYGDWLQVDAETPRAVLATAYFAHSADLVARAGAALGDAAAEAKYLNLAKRIRAAFVDAFVDDDNRLSGDTQTVYLLALAFDLLPPTSHNDLARHLVRTIEGHDGLLTTGFIGVSLICPVLTAIGRSDLAYQLLETDRFPSWLYSVRHGATTIWERWDGWTEHAGFQSAEMNSFNHYSLGSVGEWLYQDVAGIKQSADSVGYESLYIAPQVGGSLTGVSASYESSRGRIATAWTLDEGQFSLRVEIPPGANATVVLPSKDGVVTEGKLALDASPGVSQPASQDMTVCIHVSSGNYTFMSSI